jgi:hypothetical protein
MRLFERVSVKKAPRSITRFKTPLSRIVTDALSESPAQTMFWRSYISKSVACSS